MSYQFISGAYDNRTEEEKLKDLYFEEIVASANEVKWEEKKPSAWRSFPTQNQGSGGTCVAHTIRKLARIKFFIDTGIMTDFSSTFIYHHRSNKPSGGMIGTNSFDIWKNQGIPLNEFLASELKTDREIDQTRLEQYHKDIAGVFKIGGHVGVNLAENAFEKIASIGQTTGKGVMLWFYFTEREWAREVPIVMDNLSGAYDPRSLRHSVAQVDNFLFSGKKNLLIEDSAHFGGIAKRRITEEFFKERCFFARYNMNFKFNETDQVAPVPPSGHKFTKVMVFGQTSSDVVKLQDLLRRLGHFPNNTQSTGYYGALTARSVLSFQIAEKVAPLQELEQLQGRRVGEKTLNKLNTF